MANSIYPKNFTKEMVANLSEDEKMYYLYKWVTKKPTPATIAFFTTFVDKYFDEDFAEYLYNLCLEDRIRNNEDTSKEAIGEDVSACMKAWITFPEDLVDFYNDYLKEKGKEPLKADISKLS